MRADSTINFNWNSASPDPRLATSNYSVRWSGKITPRYSETYTFSAVTDDGVRLWVNGQQLINQWVDQGPTVYDRDDRAHGQPEL